MAQLIIEKRIYLIMTDTQEVSHLIAICRYGQGEVLAIVKILVEAGVPRNSTDSTHKTVARKRESQYGVRKEGSRRVIFLSIFSHGQYGIIDQEPALDSTSQHLEPAPRYRTSGRPTNGSQTAGQRWRP